MIGRKITLTLLTFVALGVTATDARADKIDDANKAYYNREYDTAFTLLKPLAEEGVAEAQYKLGWMYMYGFGTYRSFSDAIDWLTKAANQGLPEASHQVAQMYDMGVGVEKNNMLAFMWYAICKRQLDDMEQKPTTFNPTIDMNVMRDVMTPDEIEQATKLAATWKKLGPDGKPAPLPPPKEPKKDDQIILPGGSEY